MVQRDYLPIRQTSKKERRISEGVIERLCDQVLALDSSIRFVGVSNKMGMRVVSKFRNDSVPLIKPQDEDMLTIQSVLRMNTRKDFASRFGKPIYSFTLYEKVKRVTITLENKDYPILMVSFDIPCNHEHIIMNRIIPVISKEGL
jgi:hypothetical protein